MTTNTHHASTAFSNPSVWQEAVVQTPEGLVIPIQKRSRRGRKSSRQATHPLRDIRLSRGFTLEELAELSQLSPSYLSRLESGTRRLNIDTINRLSSALQCSANDLLAVGSNRPGTVSTTFGLSSSVYSASPNNANARNPYQLPVFGTGKPNTPIDLQQPVTTIPCPHDLSGVQGSYAYVVSDDTMAPRYRLSEKVLVHPNRPLTPGAIAAVITNENKVIIGEFKAWRNITEISTSIDENDPAVIANPYVLEISQYNGQSKILLQPSEILSVGRVIGSTES